MADCYLKNNCPAQSGACQGEPDEGCPVFRYFKQLLMKGWEPVKPSWSRGKPYCGKCGRMIWPRKYNDEFERKFCSYCGRMVDWT